MPQKKLYKALSRIADYMTREIVEELPNMSGPSGDKEVDYVPVKLSAAC